MHSGETAETTTHLHSISFNAPSGTASLSGSEDHLTGGVNHHDWNLSGGAAGTDGSAQLFVAHVPEPETWALMLLGLGGLAASRRKVRG